MQDLTLFWSLLQSKTLRSPSYAICTEYRNPDGTLQAERFLIFIDNSGVCSLHPLRIHFDGAVYPEVAGQGSLLEFALDHAKDCHRFRVHQIFKGKNAQDWWPV